MGSEEAVPGPSVFPSGEPGVSGDFWARASRRVEEGLSRSLSGGGGKPSCSETCRGISDRGRRAVISAVSYSASEAMLLLLSRFSRVRLCVTP